MTPSLFHTTALTLLIAAVGGCKEPDPRLYNVNYRADFSTYEIVGGRPEVSEFNGRGFTQAEKSFLLRFHDDGSDEGKLQIFISKSPSVHGTWEKADEGQRLKIRISGDGHFGNGEAVFDGKNLQVTMKAPAMKMNSTEFESKKVTMTYVPEPIQGAVEVK